VSDGTNALWADRVVTEQQTGDAVAEGSVKASYRQAGSAEEAGAMCGGTCEFEA